MAAAEHGEISSSDSMTMATAMMSSDLSALASTFQRGKRARYTSADQTLLKHSA